MRISCTQEKLKESVATIARIAQKHPTLPILRCILIEAAGRTVKLRATNLELGIEVTMPASVENEGSVAVPADLLHSYLSNLYGERTVTLSTNAGNLEITTSHSKTAIKSLPTDDFPTLPAVGGENSLTLKASEFTKGVKSVLFCASPSAIRPELGSVLLSGSGGTLIFAATDSFRLAEKRVALRKQDAPEHLLIPARNAGEIVRILDLADGDVQMFYNKNQLSFAQEGVYVTSRLIDGSFPDYQQIVPKKHTTEVIALRSDLMSAFKLGAVFSDSLEQVKMAVSPKAKTFTIQSRNADLGESVDTVHAAVSGEELAIAFNLRYLADSLLGVSGDSVSLQFSGLNKPVVIRGVSDSSYLYLVMPMNR